MALSGSLLDFGFTDILQLVKMQRKGGMLVLNSRERDITLWFHAGDLVFAQDDSRPMLTAVGARLAADGLVSPGQWKKAVEAQKGTGKPLERLPEPAEARLEELGTHYLRETAFAAFRYLEGDYTFEADVPRPVGSEAISLPPINTDDLLMESASRAEAWASVDAELPSWHLILAPAGSDGRDDPLAEVEDHVYALLDRHRDVRGVVEASRWGALETCRALVQLKVTGRARVVGQTEARPLRGHVSKAKKSRTRRIARRRPYYRAAFVAVGCAAVMALTGWLGVQSYLIPGPEATAGLFASTAQYRAHQVRQALRVYHLTHGAYPESLEALEKAGMVAPGVVNARMRYSREGDGFILSDG
jgi:hypothetical protein